MTERDLYDAALIEINKLEAPSMLLEDYNYFINKAIQQYINKAYNRYEINQQATDDLQTLKRSVSIPVNAFTGTGLPNELYYYFSVLPEDYLHMLNCVVKFDLGSSFKGACTSNSFGTNNAYVARKLTSEIYPTIINNAYFKPSYKTPYYTITELSENDILIEGIVNSNSKIITADYLIDNILGEKKESSTDWQGGKIINIRCGNDSRKVPTMIYVDYLRTPKKVNLTEEMLEGEDTSNIMEFPDYICYEIINEFVKLILENTSDPRLQTNIPINQTIIPQTSE